MVMLLCTFAMRCSSKGSTPCVTGHASLMKEYWSFGESSAAQVFRNTGHRSMLGSMYCMHGLSDLRQLHEPLQQGNCKQSLCRAQCAY